MKLNKIMKKTILATMAVLMATSLSFTGCSNGDDDPTPGSTPTGDQGTALGLSGYYNWEGSPYTISEQSDSGVTISYSGTAPTQLCIRKWMRYSIRSYKKSSSKSKKQRK